MSANSEDTDLQTYFDSIKELEESDGTLITLTPGAVESACADEAEEELGDDDQDDIEEDDTACFIDDSGNLYFQTEEENTFASSANPTTSTIAATEKKSSPNRRITTRNYTKTKLADSEHSLDDEAEAEVNYVFILDNGDDANQPSNKEQNLENVEEVNYEYVNEEAVDDPISAKSKGRGELHHCMHCDYKTDKRFVLSRHLKGHSDERPFLCAVCERGFKTNVALMNHVNVHLGKKPHACKYCEKCFTTSGEMLRHVRYRHTGEKPHKCTECDYSSVELSKLRRHIRCHTGERPYQCPHCTYASPDSFKLKRHMRTHTGEKPYECDICHARFTQSNSLKAHHLIHSIGDKPIFQCSLCPTTCGRKTDLRLHVQKLHHSDSPITCKRCGKELPDRYSYKMHIKTHEGEKCYRCEICPYASASMRHLETHMLIHTNQKPFVCKHCNYSFRQQQLLKRHINLYHNKDYVPPKPRAKAHSCPHCERAFTHKGNLMRHMELHDPDSKTHQEKINLKMGRLTRIPDEGDNATITSGAFYSDNTSEAEYEEDGYEIIETIDEDDMDEKPTISQQLCGANENVDQRVSIKREAGSNELMAVNVINGLQYTVVIDCDGGDEDDDENYLTLESTLNGDIKISNANTQQNDVGNYFGFDEDNEDEEQEYNDSKADIQLLDIIEEDE